MRLGSSACKNQTLGEDDRRSPARRSRLNYTQRPECWDAKADYSLEISLSGASVPASLKQHPAGRSQVAGQQFDQGRLLATPNQTYTFVWDGKDAYGRTVQGAQQIDAFASATSTTAVYYSPSTSGNAFGGGGRGIPMTGNPARQEVTLWQEWQEHDRGAWDARAQGLGGWDLDVHHAYDPVNQVLYLGNGELRSAI